MRTAVVTNILDCLAFFMATTDLYGVERLAALSTRLRRQWVSWKWMWDEVVVFWVVLLCVLIIGFLGIFATGFIWGFQIDGILVRVLPSGHYIHDAYASFVLSIVLTTFLLAIAAIYLICRIVYYLFAYAARGIKADGMLLTLGASVFVLSRVIAILAG